MAMQAMPAVRWRPGGNAGNAEAAGGAPGCRPGTAGGHAASQRKGATWRVRCDRDVNDRSDVRAGAPAPLGWRKGSPQRPRAANAAKRVPRRATAARLHVRYLPSAQLSSFWSLHVLVGSLCSLHALPHYPACAWPWRPSRTSIMHSDILSQHYTVSQPLFPIS